MGDQVRINTGHVTKTNRGAKVPVRIEHVGHRVLEAEALVDPNGFVRFSAPTRVWTLFEGMNREFASRVIKTLEAECAGAAS